MVENPFVSIVALQEMPFVTFDYTFEVERGTVRE
jgi:hypothetical protein